ncbi:inositol 1,4,5-trisphosphate receptor-interacting protein-like [Hypanus sabinus]|uniref:inositol 1,4,5-trisphosphate receptor-interacting protein-like n=1 Tax=Hypanus sabinus TaxID=79690 RepID=UPI0028C3830D|nr:inositol 1,4,5-trisphosphate receptor-interacting protein-like [Hypanus sabinus]
MSPAFNNCDVPAKSNYLLVVHRMLSLLRLSSVCLLMIIGSLDHPRLLSDEVEREEFRIRWKEQEHQPKLVPKQFQEEMEEKGKHDYYANISEFAKMEDPRKESWRTRNILFIVTVLFLGFWTKDIWPYTPHDENSEEEEEEEKENEFQQRIYSDILNIPDKNVLDQFYNIAVQKMNQEPMQIPEFVEGLVDNLLEACQNQILFDSELIFEDCMGIGSQFEKWGCKMPYVYDILVPIVLQDRYCFKPEICGISPDNHSYGRILMVTPSNAMLTCQCYSTEPEGHELCLIHSKGQESDVHDNYLASIMCIEGYLDYKKVVKLVRLALSSSWDKICHQYDFKVTFHKITGCCGLQVLYQSEQTIRIKVFPAVRLKDSDVFLVPSFSGYSKDASLSTTYWDISCAVHECRFLKIMAKNVPESSCHIKCLKILIFLTENLRSSSDQRYLLGSYLFKTALMHLLLSQPYSKWKECYLEHRLRDVLKYLGDCLDEKQLHRFMIGNQTLSRQSGIPEMLLKTEPMNLFRSFASDHDSYCQAVLEYQKILKEMGNLMKEYIKNNADS